MEKYRRDSKEWQEHCWQHTESRMKRCGLSFEKWLNWKLWKCFYSWQYLKFTILDFWEK